MIKLDPFELKSLGGSFFCDNDKSLQDLQFSNLIDNY